MRSVAATAALALCAGCGDKGLIGIYLLEIPPFGEAMTCSVVVEENFTDASPIDDDGTSSGGGMVFTYSAAGSPSAQFAQVIEGADGAVIVVIGEVVYEGTTDGEKIQVQWKTDSNFTDEQTHDAGYTYVEQGVTSSTETLVLNAGEDTRDLTGSFQLETADDIQYRETDEWDDALVGVPGSQMGLLTNDLLDGSGKINAPESAQCAGAECELTVGTRCAGTIGGVKAVFTEIDPAGFAGLVDATRPSGGI